MQPKPKPIRRSSIGITSRPRIPYDPPLTPGLNRTHTTSAIGFTASLARQIGDDLNRKRDVQD